MLRARTDTKSMTTSYIGMVDPSPLAILREGDSDYSGSVITHTLPSRTFCEAGVQVAGAYPSAQRLDVTWHGQESIQSAGSTRYAPERTDWTRVQNFRMETCGKLGRSVAAHDQPSAISGYRL